MPIRPPRRDYLVVFPIQPRRWAFGEGQDRIGWVEDEDLLLDPKAAFRVAQAFGRESGEHLPIGENTLRKRLDEKGLLVSKEQQRGRLTIRRTVQGARRLVLHLNKSTLISEEPAQSAQLAQTNSKIMVRETWKPPVN